MIKSVVVDFSPMPISFLVTPVYSSAFTNDEVTVVPLGVTESDPVTSG